MARWIYGGEGAGRWEEGAWTAESIEDVERSGCPKEAITDETFNMYSFDFLTG